jgi:hypothetical protein
MKRKWTRGEQIVLWGASIAMLGLIAYWIVVPEFRHATASAQETAVSSASSGSRATGSVPGQPVGVFAASVEELRARNHVTLIPASESRKTLAKIPAGSYGYVFGPYLAHSTPDALEMYTHSNPAYFEVHKLTNNQVEFVAYVGSETQERLRKGLGKGEKLTLYSWPWQKAPNLTAISLRSVKCARSWDITVRRKQGTIVLFALDCKAI